MAVKTYGAAHYDAASNSFIVTQAEPHVCIRLKSNFPRLPRTAVPPFHFPATPQNCADLQWFLQRYPLRLSGVDSTQLSRGTQEYHRQVSELERILAPEYSPPTVRLRAGHQARAYQLAGSQAHLLRGRLLLGDDLGLGKTLTGILSFTNPATLPAAVVVQTHLPKQWQREIEKFVGLRVHLVKKTTPYSLPPADVYLFKYSQLAGWTNFFTERFFQSVVFDEVQELRREDSLKYQGARVLSEHVRYVLGLSATPVYNYGDEIYSVLEVINPGCLGVKEDFLREWAVPSGTHHKIRDPSALGAYLRESMLLLRRTRADVGRELPPVNKIIHTVGYDEGQVQKSADLARALALRVTTGSFEQRGQAARELDLLARHTTGVSKAREVAQYVRFLVEAGEPVILAGWHRDVYDIWLRELAAFKPAMYTGSESPGQKEEAKRRFVDGETDVFILSLRSGVGLDGLQARCKTVVFGELDWSPKVHEQLIGRADRDGQPEQVTAIFLVSDEGSDPVIIDVLGLKASQAHGIVDPLTAPAAQYSDESRLRSLANFYLNKN